MFKLLDKLAKWWIRKRLNDRYGKNPKIYSSLPEDRK